ncbi:protein TIFY 4B-like isoform X3 [Cynara cardunculus var. scolymus]|uniref:protein TIFY 4B-like isoform X3 n=1 Tax=Cynara cardunculus var. scolymus TaxID=59895 RepID=UPI000D62B959|nr:protein TIFY 4B-like isoform X3 [Cynara cardunculus var. scolymus]
MSTEEPPYSASAMSPLDKPLHQLTEDDISQLTREDCRRYLKQKGMRRPSWNKSQAIQQVIMLKALLEPVPDSEDGGRRPYITSRQQQAPTTRVQKGTSADTEISLSAEESVPGHRNDMEKSDFVGDNDSAPTGIGGVTEEAKGQMTIFYSGKVNVYDDVPADKLAASPLQFPQEAPFDGNILQAPGINVGTDFSAMLSPILQTVRLADNYRLHKEESNMLREENSVEGSASRKASVQRYLEKRKDRFKSKRKAGAPACATTIDVYLNHQIGNHNLHEQSSRSATCSPPPVRPPNTPNRFS